MTPAPLIKWWQSAAFLIVCLILYNFSDVDHSTKRQPIQAPAPESTENKTRHSTGSASYVGVDGLWLTAHHVVKNCHSIYLLMGGKQEAAHIEIYNETNKRNQIFNYREAKVEAFDSRSDLALLSSSYSSTRPIRVSYDDKNKPPFIKINAVGYITGFPKAWPGDATAKYIGDSQLNLREPHPSIHKTMSVWNIVNNTIGSEEYGGISGGPTLDEAGNIIGVNVAVNYRRNRFFTSRPEDIYRFLGKNFLKQAKAPSPTLDRPREYTRNLRDNNQVIRVVCQAN